MRPRGAKSDRDRPIIQDNDGNRAVLEENGGKLDLGRFEKLKESKAALNSDSLISLTASYISGWGTVTSIRGKVKEVTTY